MNENRIEKIFKVDMNKKYFLNNSFSKKDHSKTYITTVYFGATSELWEGVQSLSALKCGIRLRYYQTKKQKSIFIVDNKELCNLEFKTHKNTSRENKKIYVSKESGVCLEEVVRYLNKLVSNESLSGYEKYDGITEVLKPLIKEFGIKSIFPIGAVNYLRYRYADSDNINRITFDFNVNYYLSCFKDTDLIMSKVGRNNYTVVEIKGNIDENNTEIEKKLFDTLKCNYEQVTRTKAKGIKEYLEKMHFIFCEPELLEKDKYDWEIMEREIKLDASINPKAVVDNVIDEMKKDGLIVGACRPNVNYQFAFNVGGSGLIYMDKDGKGTKAVIKYKDYISHNENNGTLVRYEFVEPYTEENFRKALNKFGIKEKEVEKSPYFKRDRILVNFINPKTKNVFELYADHSYFLDNSNKNDFYQVEIEFAGIILESNKKIDEAKMIDNINSDFNYLSNIIPMYYSKYGCVLTKSTRTKYEWVKKECFDE